MKYICRQVYLLLMACFILNCTNSGITGGGGIDIGNPTKICIVDSLNRPVPFASVKIISSDNWFDVILGGKGTLSDSVFTDASGFVSFDSLTSGSYNLQIDYSFCGAYVNDFRVTDYQTIRIITVKKYGEISGTISSNSGKPVQINLIGTTYSAPISSDGSYKLTNIPEGSYIPVVRTNDSRWTVTNMISVKSSNTTVSVDNVCFDTLLIDDFEDSLNTLKLGRFVKGSFIYAGHASEVQGSADYQIVSGGIGGGKALKGTLITQGAWALVGFSLGIKPPTDSLWDLSMARGLSFLAKGTGKLNISIESDTIDKMGLYKHYSADIELQKDWTHITIPFDSLTFYKDNNPNPAITWKEASKSVKRIEFNALEGDTVQFWLDELKVNGVDISKVY